MTATDPAVGRHAAGPGELLDQIVGALAGFGALDVAVLRDEAGHRVAEIVVDGAGERDNRCRILLSADVTERVTMALPAVHTDGLPTAALVAERERVARDLHDGVVQDVFATAMTLAALLPILPAEVGRRIEDLIDRQDEIVRRLRTTVFALKGCGAGGSRARDAIERVASEAARALGFSPTLAFDGSIDSLDGTEALDHLLMAFRESLSNIARHARASTVEATVAASTDGVRLVVADDGDGAVRFGAPVAGDGLRNLDERARLFGGRCTIGAGRDRGTVVEWSVPRLSTSPAAQPLDGRPSVGLSAGGRSADVRAAVARPAAVSSSATTSRSDT